MTKQWLRAYKLHIYTKGYSTFSGTQTRVWGDEITITDPIRCTFSMKKTMLRNSSSGSITLWNLTPELEAQIISDGVELVLEAGYEGSTSIIFAGTIVQPIRGKENGTDYFLKLICLDGDSYYNLAFSKGTIESNQTKRELAKQTLRASNYKDLSTSVSVTDLEDIPDISTVDMSSPRSERPKVVFGRTSKIIDELARMGNSMSYMDNGELKFFTVDTEVDRSNAWEINSSTGMIGCPEQSSYQVIVRTLLNPKIRIKDFIHLDNKSIRVEELDVIGSLAFYLEPTGYYQVIEISYSGDTRGNDWYSTIKAITKDGVIPSQLSTRQGNLIV